MNRRQVLRRTNDRKMSIVSRDQPVIADRSWTGAGIVRGDQQLPDTRRRLIAVGPTSA